MKKTLFVMALVAIVMSLTVIPAAGALHVDEFGNREIAIIDHIMTSPGTFYSFDGEDITEEFLSKMNHMYNENRYEDIWAYMQENMQRFEGTSQITTNESEIQPFSSRVQGHYHKDGVELVDELYHGLKQHNYVMWEMDSDIVLDTNEGVLVSVQKPIVTLDVFYHYGGDDGEYTYTSQRTINNLIIKYSFDGEYHLLVSEVADYVPIRLAYKYKISISDTFVVTGY